MQLNTAKKHPNIFCFVDDIPAIVTLRPGAQPDTFQIECDGYTLCWEAKYNPSIDAYIDPDDISNDDHSPTAYHIPEDHNPLPGTQARKGPHLTVVESQIIDQPADATELG